MNDLAAAYRQRYENGLKMAAEQIQNSLQEILSDEPRVDRITARAKSVERFLAKARTIKDGGGGPKYADPIHEIQDQIGARVVVFYSCDCERIENRLLAYIKHIEKITIVPESHWEFGYFGRHQIVLMDNYDD